MSKLDDELDKIIIKELFGGKIPLDTEEDRELAYRIPAFKQILKALISEQVISELKSLPVQRMGASDGVDAMDIEDRIAQLSKKGAGDE